MLQFALDMGQPRLNHGENTSVLQAPSSDIWSHGNAKIQT